MRGLARLLTLSVIAWAMLASVAHAATEVGDAGELPATAQNLGGETELDSISGTLDGLVDRDVYRMCLSGDATFSASTVGGTDVDTQLFLLDADGRGVYANDDAPGVVGQSLLPAGDPLTPTQAGVYNLAISRYNQDPAGFEGVPLFPDSVTTVPAQSDEPIATWTNGREGTYGPYSIALTGVVPCEQPDTTAPAIDLRTPPDGATYTVGDVVAADFDCTDEQGGSGVATCVGTVADGAAIDTSAAGPRTFTVTATDAAGNQSTASAGYVVEEAPPVGFPFEGFFSPLDDPVNRVKAGDVVAVRFSLDGYRGKDPIADDFPRSAEVDCNTFADADPDTAQATDTPWSRWRHDVRYQPWNDTYVYMWDTERRWAGDCRQLIVKLSDGSIHRANVVFPKRRQSCDWPWSWLGYDARWGRCNDHRGRDGDRRSSAKAAVRRAHWR